eukprot:CAMPEP_0197465590 /NCGR_PEP_ID=MMETSP1175-20131217/64620_1 /TAXON_ID=1003142 /ORGANISM="Triceratium dubium, Strain CCMP147" /LENGTH=382 /DNA_ID=CAMNT_0043001609 /DNA_START=34 /DNA_END=1179 /DNA_ORIENTATION=+
MKTGSSILLFLAAHWTVPAAQAQQLTTDNLANVQYCEVLPAPTSVVTLNDTSISKVLLGLECPQSGSAVVPESLNFQLTEDATAQAIVVEMNPPNLVVPTVDANGRLSFLANGQSNGAGIKLTIPAAQVQDIELRSPTGSISPTIGSRYGYSADNESTNLVVPTVGANGRLSFLANGQSPNGEEGIKLTIPAAQVQDIELRSPTGSISPTIGFRYGYSADLRLLQPYPGLQLSATGGNSFFLTHFTQTPNVDSSAPVFVTVIGNNHVVQVTNVPNVAVEVKNTSATGKPNELSIWATPASNPNNVDITWESSNGEINVVGEPNATLTINLAGGTGNKVLTGISCDNVVDTESGGQLVNNECEFRPVCRCADWVYLNCLSGSG